MVDVMSEATFVTILTLTAGFMVGLVAHATGGDGVIAGVVTIAICWVLLAMVIR